jgi:Na+/proline symporter
MLNAAATYSIIFVTLAAFAAIALLFLRFGGVKFGDRDTYFAARNQSSARTLALSYFASAMGAWVIFAVAEIGTYAGSLGVAGYALASICPLILLAVIAPYMRKTLPQGVTFQEFVQQVRPQPIARILSADAARARAINDRLEARDRVRTFAPPRRAFGGRGPRARAPPDERAAVRCD